MAKVYLGMAIHFHQPTGNFKYVVERACQLCYSPFLNTLSRYPQIKMTFHISGCLLDYFEEEHSEILDLIAGMVSSGQIEMMSGGYYEPILTAIPERDITGQIRMMSDYIKSRFATDPQGMWIPERVWEPSLAEPIHNSGIRYSILDDNHFLNSGVDKEDTFGFFLTGRAKEAIAVYPSDKQLRYMIPFRLPQEAIDYFRSKAAGREGLIFVYGDDGEKFGEWPGTHKWVFEELWLENFFKALLENRDWIETIKLSDYLNNNQPSGRLKINPGSYEEMMEWSGGSWLNFLSKYPETNQMHKKMLYVSGKINGLEKKCKGDAAKKLQEAKRELYKGQCNCGYWHGVFGGLYLYHLRSAVYQHLIAAEKITDGILHPEGAPWLDIKQMDFDTDGKKEVIIEDRDLFVCLDPDEGAVIKELDYKPLSFNLLNTLSRKKEAYHHKILEALHKEGSAKVATIHEDYKTVNAGVTEHLVYDKFPRYSLRNYFVRGGLRLSDFMNSNYEELGDFARGAYAVAKKDRAVILKRRSEVLSSKIELSKRIEVRSGAEIEVCYALKKTGDLDMDALFGLELNLTMPYLNADRYHYVSDDNACAGIKASGAAYAPARFGIKDFQEGFSVSLLFSQKPLDVWYFPVETVSQSEKAYELNYQCSCIFPRWKPEFSRDNVWNLKIKWDILK